MVIIDNMLLPLLRNFLASLLIGWTSLSQAGSEELKTRAAIFSEVAALWQKSDGQALENMAQSMRLSRARTPSGIWKLSVFNGAVDAQIAAAAAAGKSWDQLLADAQSHARASPASPFALMQPTRVLLVQAWSVRGHGPASTVPESSMARFNILTQRADEALHAVRASASADPTWYELALNLALFRRKSVQESRALFEEAVSREREFLQHYFVMSNHHSPRWGGSAESLESFVRGAIAPLAPAAQEALYARIYWWVSDMGYFPRLADSKVDCNRMMRGARQIADGYPDAWNINNLARLAGQCGDQATARYFVQRIGEQPLVEAWGSGSRAEENFRRVQSWAGK